jgi:hypothetical protein
VLAVLLVVVGPTGPTTTNSTVLFKQLLSFGWGGGVGGGIPYYNTSEASDTSGRILKFRTGGVLVTLIYIKVP